MLYKYKKWSGLRGVLNKQVARYECVKEIGNATLKRMHGSHSRMKLNVRVTPNKKESLIIIIINLTIFNYKLLVAPNVLTIKKKLLFFNKNLMNECCTK